MTPKKEKQNDQVRYLPLDPDKPGEILQNLRINALAAHQNSVGKGNILLDILQRTTQQLEKTNGRIQMMNTILFIAGLIMLAAGVYQVIWGREGQEAWAALLGGVGGVSTLSSIFWTGPLRRISESVQDMIKLETAFLGYIRIIGEADSAFQMQYLDKIVGAEGLELDVVTDETIKQVKEAMTHTLDMISKHVTQKDDIAEDVKAQITDLETRLKKLEGPPQGDKQ